MSDLPIKVRCYVSDRDAERVALLPEAIDGEIVLTLPASMLLAAGLFYAGSFLF